MKVERFGKRYVFIPSLIGLAVLAAPSVAWSQQQGQAQGQREGDIQVAVAPGSVQQPQQQMSWNEARVVKVKSDRIGEFEGLVKELAAAMSEQGAPGFDVMQVVFGEQSTYHMVAQLQSLASLEEMAENPPMEPMQWANWVNRIEDTIDSQELLVAQFHPDLSIMPQQPGAQAGALTRGQAGGQSGAPAQAQAEADARPASEPAAQTGGPMPELMILVRQTLLPGKRQEYETWLRDEMLPALRGSDIMGLFSNEIAFGAENRTWVFAVPVAGWAELDEPMPLYRSMGPQAAEQLLARGDSMVDHSETLVLRMRPELSAPGGQPGQQQSGSQQLGQQGPQQR